MVPPSSSRRPRPVNFYPTFTDIKNILSPASVINIHRQTQEVSETIPPGSSSCPTPDRRRSVKLPPCLLFVFSPKTHLTCPAPQAACLLVRHVSFCSVALPSSSCRPFLLEGLAPEGTFVIETFLPVPWIPTCLNFSLGKSLCLLSLSLFSFRDYEH